jgi:hypothetical protein
VKGQLYATTVLASGNGRLESVHKNIDRRTRRWSDALDVLLLQHSWQFYYADCFEFFFVCSLKLKKYAY